jgi:ABC-type lipoprotein export system ATPase subunit
VSVVRITDLSVDYLTVAGPSPALIDVSLECDPGRLSVVAGPSGSGKSTLLRVLAGLHRPKVGTVEIGGRDLAHLRPREVRRRRRRTMGIVLQNPSDNLLEELTAIEQIELAAQLRGVDQEPATELLELVGMGDQAGSLPSQLSGGEQQRIAFAAAAAGRPLVLLADEPTAQLDAAAGQALIGAMRDLVGTGTTLIVASHDEAVLQAADHVIHLRDGRVAR